MRKFYSIVGVVLLIPVAGCGDTALNKAIAASDLKQVQALIDAGKDINAAGTWWRTPLHTAFKSNNKEVYEILLKKGADPNRCDADGASIMHLAAQREDLFWLKLAIQHGGNVDQLNTGSRFIPGATPIYYALCQENTPAALELIAAKANVNHKTKEGWHVIYAAMQKCMYTAALELITAGADLGGKNEFGQTFAMQFFDDAYEKHAAAMQPEYPAYLQIKELLIERGLLERHNVQSVPASPANETTVPPEKSGQPSDP